MKVGMGTIGFEIAQFINRRYTKAKNFKLGGLSAAIGIQLAEIVEFAGLDGQVLCAT